MLIKIIFYISIILLIVSCSDTKNPVETKQGSKVYGFLKINDSPIVNADVQIDDVLNWKSTTNDKGYFEIKDVTKGEHLLKSSKTKENGQLVSVESNISTNDGDTDLGEILLPVPPLLYEINDTKINQNMLELSWSPSYNNDFREYKVYRKTDAGIDENTGELIFVSTENQDTTFIDDSFNMGLDYYYRVFTLSAYGKLGGSNVVKVNTPKLSIVLNGDFELPLVNNAISNWYSSTDVFTLDSLNVFSGNYSVKAHKPAGAMNDYNLNQDIPVSKFIAGKTYRFSVKMKSENTVMGAFIYYYKNGMNVITTNLKQPLGMDWGELFTEFQVPTDASVLTVRLWISDSYTEEETGWFDEIHIELK